MRRSLWVIACLVLAAGLGACGSDEGGGGSRDVNWYVFDEPSGAYDKAIENCNKQSGGRYQIKLVPLPTDANQQRELLVRRLAAQDKDIDLAGMDVIWTAEFAEAKWIKPVPADKRAEIEGNTLSGPLKTAQYKGQLWGVPLSSNTQVLWYRKDRVKQPPKTWADMLREAERIGANGKIQVQAARYEGFTVWFNSLVASAGGSILKPNGDVSLGPPADQAGEVMRNLARSSAADPAISNSKEDSARLAFQSGSASFMLNYPFVYPSAKEEAPDVFKNLGAAPYPRVDPNKPSRAPVGGINLGVSSYSDNPDLAFDAAMCLRNPQNQIGNATLGGLPPTIESLYASPEIQKAYPGFANLLKSSIATGSPRPVTPAYSDISLTIQDTLHPPADIEIPATIDELRSRLNEVEEGGLF